MATTSPALVAAPTARRPRRVVALAVGAAAALVAAAGCASAAGAEGNEPTAVMTYEGAQTSFGKPFKYGNGLFLQIKEPVAFTPTSQAEGVDEVEGQPVRIRITVTNGTRGQYTAHTFSATVESGGVPATQIIDPGSQIDLTGPSTELGPANVVTFDLAYVVADPRDITMTVVPALGGYDPLVLTTR
ncbi:hypothetical protein [Cellulomonas phragmiteti]|uniref:DUF4352 domain-containing protein n=1 Tax=Cellulomonas phragmiteti TaxID=478780 RepID=A0ABQ4DPU2_9CELL|nr:hypothetical protein [Cellulomonas phragmiteti]GIG41358.1 hypothetical protein Cph01nite_31200 [Cellulomonas phragmiteti]